MKTTRICPKCKSNDVRRIRGGLIDVLGFSENFVCDECGFSSPIFPDIEVSESKKKVKPAKVSNSLKIVFIVVLILFIISLIIVL